MDTAQQLKFIADFANMDLKATREGDWINLQEDLARFFLGPDSTGGMVFVLPGILSFFPQDKELKKYPKPKLISLQGELRALLMIKAPPVGVSRSWSFNIEIDYFYQSYDRLIASGKIRDLFLQRVINLLGDPAVSSKIRQCPECSKFFLRVRRQIYCSPPCVDKANKREWLKTESGRRYLKKAKRGKK